MSETPVQRLRRLMVDVDPFTHDALRPTPRAPLGPYGQNSDPVAAFVNFQSDLAEVFKALDQAVGKPV